jgi:hypothetical protein
MTSPSTTTAISSSDLKASVELVEIKPGIKFSRHVLTELLPDVETTLFFAKTYELDAATLSRLLQITVKNGDLTSALFSGDHSTELQDYLVGVVDDYNNTTWSASVNAGEISYGAAHIKGEILPQVWKSLEVTIAQSIRDVATKLTQTFARLPGKQGRVAFDTLMKMNAKRPTVGTFEARVKHDPTKENLLILDVSGSMRPGTIKAIINDVVALAYMANAHLAIVSDSATYWAPGTYDTDSVLEAAEYQGTHYEQLGPVLNGRDWGVVITVADYDSSRNAMSYLANEVTSTIDEVVDISLVGKTTFLAQCVGQFAKKVTPVLVGNSEYVLQAY